MQVLHAIDRSYEKSSLDSQQRFLSDRLLGRGIDICIGYGFGESNYYEEQARKWLDKIAQGKRGRLFLYRIGDVHSKVLICDEDFMIITSFNWFSFKGDPKRGSRVEDGILTRDKNAIATKTEEWLNRFQEVTQAV